MKKIFAYTIIALLGLCASCISTESSDKVTKLVFEIDNDKIAISPNGGDFFVTLRSSEAWTLKSSEGSEWCVPSVTEGDANVEGVRIYFSADWSYEDREAIFWFEITGMSRQLIVSQRAKAVILPNDNNEFIIPAAGGLARIEFGATYPCDVVIPADAQGWVERVVESSTESRVVENYVVDLDVAENLLYEARETVVKVVVVGSEEIFAEYTIKQAQRDAILPGDNNTFEVGADGDIIQVMFEANIDWKVVVSEDGQEWIVVPEATRALREECVELEVLPNEGYSSRSATIMVVAVEDDMLFVEYTVNQSQRDTILGDEESIITVTADGEDVEIGYNTNVECEVVIPEDVDWIIPAVEPTRALERHSAMLTVLKNTTNEAREAIIKVVGVNNDKLYVEYVIKQLQNDVLYVDGGILVEVASTGGEKEIAYMTNVECEVVIPEDVAWISVKEATRGLRAESAVLVIEPNDTYDERSALVKVVMVGDDKLAVSYTIRQAQMDEIILDGDKIEATVDGGKVDLGYKANIDCEVVIPEGCEWIYVAPVTRGLEERNLSLIIEANDAFEPREEVVTITGAGINRDITVTQEAKRLDIAVKEYEVAVAATTLEVAVDANVKYDVVVEQGCDWIAVADVEDNPSGELLLLNIAENETIYERRAEVRVKHGEREVVLVVVQSADEGLLNVDEEFVVEGGATELVVALESNFTYMVNIPEECDWVELPAARRATVQSSSVRFLVHRNPTVLERGVDIEFADSKNTVSKTIRIKQQGNHLLEVFEVADNEILYITTDGEKLRYNNSNFGSSISNNTYADGYGKITFDGTVTQLGNKVFENCTNLKQIAIPAGVASIGDYAFRGCKALEDVFIPQGIKQIGVGAFKDSNIAEVLFADGSVLESIGKEGFAGCKNIKDVIIPADVKSLGNSAFSNCSNLESIILAQGVEALGANVFGGCYRLEGIVIPDGVKLISDCAFLNCTNLQQVRLGEGVEKIGMSAFSGCTSLESVLFPDGVKVIDNSAFYNCRAISEVIFSEASELTTIGNNAFNGCIAVQCVVIPESVESVGTSAFSGCAGELVVNAEIADATTASGTYYGSLFESVVVGDAVTAIGDNAFYGHKSIKTLELGAGLKRIGANAFAGCSAIIAVELPEGVETIGKSAFNGCGAVERVVIPASVTSLGASAFVGCAGELMINTDIVDSDSAATSLFNGAKFSSIIVGDAVTSIGSYAFAGVTTIEQLSLGGSVQRIGDRAFSGCNALALVEMPASVTEIGEGLFANCTSLSSVVLSDGIDTISDASFLDCTQLTSVETPESAVAIGKEAFKNCANLVDFVIPAGVESIGDSAFYGCAAIREVNMPSSVATLGKSAYAACTSLENVVFSEALTSISESAFAGCSAMGALNIPDGVTTIGKAAFKECDALTAFVLLEESQLSTIGSEAFYGCDILARIDFPATITSIGDQAFSNCVNLGEVDLGATTQLTTIGNNAFNGCNYVSNVVLSHSVTSIGTSAFVGCGGSLTLNANVANGTSATAGIFNGTKFTDVVVGEEVTSIGDYAFAGCDTIERAALGANVTSIGKGAFKDCVALSETNIPASIVTIGSSAYSGCSAIKAVELGDALQLTTIGEKAFNGCTSVESVVIPHNVTSIGTSAFVGCAGLLTMNAEVANGASATAGIFNGTKFTDVVVGEEVTSIGDYAFAGCDTIESVALGANVTSVGKAAFRGCSAIVDLSFGEASQLTTIGSEAFSGCVQLRSIAIPNSVATISAAAFKGCTEIVDVKFGDDILLATIGSEAFSGCSKILHMNLPDSVTHLGASSFEGCTSLISAIMGVNMAQVDRKAFKGCKSLSIVYSNAAVPPVLGGDVFSGCSSELAIYVPTTSLDDYYKAQGWRNYREIIVGSEL